MRIAIVSKDKKACESCKAEAAKRGFVHDEETPDVVITYGGDGTLLHAERRHPSIPKVALRGSPTSQKSHDYPFEKALDALQKGAFTEERQLKLECVVARKGRKPETLIALNDIIVRNTHLERAVRFSMALGKERIGDILIGDGFVIATPFGSSAYYNSITKRSFTRGLGIAFNNLTTEQPNLLVDEDVTVAANILRGPADLAADNLRLDGILDEGDTVTIRRARLDAILLRPDS